MLRSLKNIEHYNVNATDGDIGRVVNFLFDDKDWAVRYLVVDTGGFFEMNRVLISPSFFREAEWSSHTFLLNLTKEKVKASPCIDLDKPVSRQMERKYHKYYGFPYYWGSSGLWGLGASPGMLSAGGWTEEQVDEGNRNQFDVHLRSDREVRGYHIQGTDHAIGHVEDFIVDDETWQIRYLAIDTSNWWFGKSVLIAPQWASRISWAEEKVFVDLPRETIKNSPEWDATVAVNRQFETRLYDYYGRPVYWVDDEYVKTHKLGDANLNE